MTTTACDDQFAPEPVAPVRQPYDTAAILRRNVADAEKEMQRQAERAESYAEAMRSLASYVGAGGYNADAVDAGVFEDKIRWGIGEIIARMKNTEAELEAVREDNHSMMLEIDGLRTERDALAAELAKLREQKPALYMAFSECGQFIRYWTRDTANLDATMAVNDFTVLEFYASPIPAFAAQQAATAPIVPEEWREVMAGLVGIAEAKGKKQGSPNHSHSRPGIWDDDNIRNGLAGKRCAECEMYDRARALLQSVEVRMIDDKLLATYESRVEAAMQESDDPIAIGSDDPAELIEIIRNARRYLALRGRGLLLCPDEGWIGDAELDAAADRLLEGVE